MTVRYGSPILSDEIGNMLSDGTWTYTWEHGRELASMSNGSTTWSMTYNTDGLRTKRTNGSTTYSYIYNGSSLSRMTVGSNTLCFAYDASGTPLSVTYNGTAYYYVTNIQGDVLKLVNTSGATVVEYAYDAWGNILTTTGSMASTLGATNPLRYRGYVFDQDTGLYYLQSRYYDPEMGRFINADALASTGQGLLGNNMFAYCRNNPVRRIDIAGNTDHDCLDTDPLDEENLLKDSQGGGGPSSWSIFLQSLDDATSGLTMPTNRKIYSGSERHHIISDKSNTYTPQYKEVTDRYNYSLHQRENIIPLENHKGRHTNAYHNFILTGLYALDRYADGDPTLFICGMEAIAEYIREKPWLPYAR